MSIINDSDAGFKDLKAIIRAIDRTTIKTGFIESKKGNRRKKGELDNVAVATIHEFGATIKHKNGKTTTIKKRSFMRPPFDKNKEKYEDNLEKGITVALKTKRKEVFTAATTAIGLQMKADIQSEITGGNFAPLAESTIKRKGSSEPLIDTSEMLQGVNYFVSKEK